MKQITPAILFEAADALSDNMDYGIGYMCHAVAKVVPHGCEHEANYEFDKLLRLHDVIDPRLGYIPNWHDDWVRDLVGYPTDQDKMAIRFMFLEFLAYSLTE